MRLSVQTDYALRTLMYLAAHDGQHSIAGGFVECFDVRGNGCVVTPVCGLRHVLADGIESFLRHLDGFTLADLVGDKAKFRAVWT